MVAFTHGYVSERMLNYVSQVSNAALNGSIPEGFEAAFDYEKNTDSRGHRLDIPTPSQIEQWCLRQPNYPSFQLSTAVLSHPHK